jgi:negative regulator of flagellin synthesis FlgM
MVSDIKGFESLQPGGPRAGDVGKARADAPVRAERGTEASSRDDTVELSGLAEVVATAARRLAAEPAVDQARVQEIRKALASGSYTADPARIARKLIEADTQY